MAFSLAACQTHPVAPAGGTGTVAEFFKGVKGRWFSIALPAGWVAKSAGTDTTPMIVATDNWEKYQNKDTDSEALGIIIVPLTDKGTPEQVLGIVVERLKTLLAGRKGEVVLEQRASQGYAWAEYDGVSIQDQSPLHYFVAVIATEQRSMLVYTSVASEQQENVRPKYQTIVKAITLH